MNPLQTFLLVIFIARCSGTPRPVQMQQKPGGENSSLSESESHQEYTTAGREGSREDFAIVTSLDETTTLPSSSKEIGVLGIPFRYGQRKQGVEEAPTFIREAGVLEDLSALGFRVTDYGDVKVEGDPSITEEDMHQSDMVGTTSRNIRDAVAKVLKTGSVSVNLGGDHTISIGTVIAHAEATSSDVALLWVDAHGDINTARSSYSGNIHGMPVAFLLHEMARYVTKPKSFEWIQPCVYKENFAYIALRDVDPYERYFMDKLGITQYNMAEVDRLGIRETIQQVLKKINPDGTKSLHVSFDIDSIDELIVPSTGTPVIGGLTMREALVIAEEVYKSGQLRVLDLSEINPRLGTQEDAQRTVKCGTDLIKAFFGSERRGDLPLVIDPNVVDVNASSGDAQWKREKA